MSRPTDLLQGTLDLLILKILERDALHGWAIGRHLRASSGEVLKVSEGSLYPALHKLEHRGWIKAEWRASENNRRAKFYKLTRAGRNRLHTESAEWARRSAAISAIVTPREA